MSNSRLKNSAIPLKTLKENSEKECALLSKIDDTAGLKSPILILRKTCSKRAPPQEVQAVLDLFEGEISIYERETEKGPKRFLKIKKMHNQKYLESELPLGKEKTER
jgi:hypothetical protein